MARPFSSAQRKGESRSERLSSALRGKGGGKGGKEGRPEVVNGSLFCVEGGGSRLALQESVLDLSPLQHEEAGIAALDGSLQQGRDSAATGDLRPRTGKRKGRPSRPAVRTMPTI